MLAHAHPHSLQGTHAWRRDGGHRFTLKNNCPTAVQPKIVDTKCGFSPRMCENVLAFEMKLSYSLNLGCADAAAFTGQQPGSLAPGASKDITIDNNVRRPLIPLLSVVTERYVIHSVGRSHR